MSTLQPLEADTELILYVPGFFPKNINRTAGAHWSALMRAKRRAFAHLQAAYLRTQPRIAFDGPVTVRVTRLIGFRGKKMDRDNLNHAAKYLVDALKRSNEAEKVRRLGIIDDDRPEVCDLHVEQLRHDDRNTRRFLQRHGVENTNTREPGTLIVIEGIQRAMIDEDKA